MFEGMEIKSKGFGCEKASETQKFRPFYKYGAAAALFSTLTFGGMNFSSFGGREAKAETVYVQGEKIAIEAVSDTIANLEKKSARDNKVHEEVERDGSYFHLVTRKKVFSFDAILLKNGIKGLVLSFPKSKADADADVHSGELAYDLAPLSDLAKKVSGQDFTRVKLIVEETVIKPKGEPVFNGIVLPLDRNGNPIKFGAGYIAMELSYYPQKGGAGYGLCLVIEPGVTGPFSKPDSSVRKPIDAK
jgi:hypothetical protein